ncbi:MAG: hypothetical protein VX938_12720, partial [Myxococcota bacterium]|nr:hypothetical protein [Myxococcota bacterium]
MVRSPLILSSSLLMALSLVTGCTGPGADDGRQAPPSARGGFGALPTAGPGTAATGTCSSDTQCPSGDPCSKGVCQGGTCTTTPVNGGCDDGDPCTESDQCTAGVCAGSPVVCDDGIPCTNDYCWGSGGCTSVPSKETHCELQVMLVEPKRGATILGNGPISVSGHVSSPAGPLSTLTVGGQPVDPEPNGSFTATIQGRRGINVLEVTATDSFERTDRVLQSFAFGADAHPPGTKLAPAMIHKGIGLWLDSSFFDDDQPDLDDVAALVLDILNGFNLDDAIPHPLFPPGEEPTVAFCTWNLDLTNVKHAVGPIDIQPIDGGLQLDLQLVDVVGSISADSVNCPDVFGPIFVDTIQVNTTTSVEMAFQQGLSVNPESVTVSLTGLNIHLEDQGSVLNGLIDWVEEEIQALVAEELETRVPQAVLPMVEGLIH